jgi:hypothetical protein
VFPGSHVIEVRALGSYPDLPICIGCYLDWLSGLTRKQAELQLGVGRIISGTHYSRPIRVAFRVAFRVCFRGASECANFDHVTTRKHSTPF